jgi:non-ribosomal peptide synthetase component F
VNATAEVVSVYPAEGQFKELTDIELADISNSSFNTFQCGAVVPWKHTATAPEIFSEIASRHPSAIAIKGDNENDTLTYEQLLCAVERLAIKLVELGVMRGAHVALLLERAPEMVVAIYAVASAGAAYVPIDPGDVRLG